MTQPISRLLLVIAAVSMLFGCTQETPVSDSKKNAVAIARPAAPSLVSRIAFGSCNKHDKPQPLWQPIVSNKPDIWLWTGDIVYADTTDMKAMESKYQSQKANKDYQTLLRTTTVIGTWDDHDYGQNNAGKEYTKRTESQQLLLDFLDEPANSPRRRQNGVYTSYIYGPPGKQVKVILLDVRYHKDAPGADGDLLGEQQWSWLEKELKNSKAAINLIASGIQIIPEEHKYEKWANWPKARQRLLKLIESTKVPGVILISGDRHFAEISKIKTNGYPLYEITSSGMTHSWDNLKEEANRYREGNLFKYLHFGQIEINWNSKPVIVKLQIRDRQNQIQLQKQIPLSELKVTGER